MAFCATARGNAPLCSQPVLAPSSPDVSHRFSGGRRQHHRSNVLRGALRACEKDPKQGAREPGKGQFVGTLAEQRE